MRVSSSSNDGSPAGSDETRLGTGYPDVSSTRFEPVEAGLPVPPDQETTLGTGGPVAGLAAVRDPELTIGAADTIVPGGPGEGPLAPGHAFGARYHIISVVGVGGMGAVYRAWDQELGVLVALKVIRPEVQSDPETARVLERRFKQELLLARKVTHRNVVRIHDLGEVRGIKYITMPFIEGEDLSAILKRNGAVPLPNVMRIVRPLLAGLVSAHEAGIVHRDLKPANVMIDSAGEALVMDFGVARSADPAGDAPAALAGVPPAMRAAAIAGQTAAGSIVGTIDYMAPEQARGEAVDQRADIYALGLILYDLLLGRRRAERAESAIAELQQRMQTAPPSPRSILPEIPEAVDVIIARCLEPDPAKRFQTSAELQAALARLDDNGKPLPMVRRLTRRMIALTGVLVLALLAGTFFGAKRFVAPPKTPDPVTVVIADLQNSTTDPTFDNTVGQTLRRALEEASFISAFDRTRLRPMFGVQPPEKFDEVAARELAVKQGLGIVLAGSVAPSGQGYEISVKAVQTITGNVVSSVTGVARSKEQVLETATRLMAKVRRALGDGTSQSAQLFAMRTLSASSLDVVSHYAAGMEAQSNGKYEDARQALLKAVELDPKFGLGYQGLAIMSRNLDRLDDADRYIKEALRYLDGMTERERFSTRGFYYRMIGDNQQCAKEYGDLIARYGADVIARNQRAICLAKLRDVRGAMEEMRHAVEILPNLVALRGNLALFMSLAGDFAGAEREIKTIQRPDPRAILALAYSQIGRGAVPEAAGTYQRLATMGAAGASSAASGLADLAIYEGRFSDAIEILEKGAAADLTAKNAQKAAIKFTSIAYVHLLAGRKGRAVSAAETALRHSKSMAVRFLAARVFAGAGALEKARSLARDLTSERAAEPRVHGRIIEGLIALKSGNPRNAITIFAEANETLNTWFGHFELGLAYVEIGAWLEADSEFDRCISRRGEALSLMDEGPTFGYFPAVYYYQGRVREEMKTEGFADSYRKYLEVRGESRDDPLTRDVRNRLGN